MVLVEMVPSKLTISAPLTAPKVIALSDNLPTTVPWSTHRLEMLTVPVIAVPVTTKVTWNVPVVVAYVELW